MSRYSRQRIDGTPPDNNRLSTPQRGKPHHTTPETDTETDTGTTDTTTHTSTSPSPAQEQVHFFQVARDLSRHTWTTHFCTERATRQSTNGPWPSYGEQTEPTEQVVMVYVIQEERELVEE